MRKLAIVLLLAIVVALLFPAVASAQRRSYWSDNMAGTGWFPAPTCPLEFEPADPPENRPGTDPVYRIKENADGPGWYIYVTPEVVNRGYTVSGIFIPEAREAARRMGRLILIPGRPPEIKCNWRPIGGKP